MFLVCHHFGCSLFARPLYCLALFLPRWVIVVTCYTQLYTTKFCTKIMTSTHNFSANLMRMLCKRACNIYHSTKISITSLFCPFFGWLCISHYFNGPSSNFLNGPHSSTDLTKNCLYIITHSDTRPKFLNSWAHHYLIV